MLVEIIIYAGFFIFIAIMSLPQGTPLTLHTFAHSAITLAGLMLWIGAGVFALVHAESSALPDWYRY